MNDYSTFQPVQPVEETPELDILIGRFQQLNFEIKELIGNLTFKINKIKYMEEIDNAIKRQDLEEKTIINLLEQQLLNLERNRGQLTKIYSHLQTII